jgi:hypothetical protein
MSRKERIDQLRRNSDWFLKMLAVQVNVLGRENWVGLPEDTHNDEVLPFLAGFTHKDYVDGPNLWEAIPDEDILLKYIVLTEGFSRGFGQIRDVFANAMAESLPVSRHATGAQEMKRIQAQRDQDAAVAIFMTGNRGLTSPLKPGVQLMMGKQDVLYPFVNLSDTPPAFPSGSDLSQNVGELLQRTLLNRGRSTEYLYLMKPITRLALDEMKEGKKGKVARAEVMGKLEVLRAYGVLKTALEVASLGLTVVNPLVNNLDNIPLLRKAQYTLVDDKDRVLWLAEKGYFPIEEIKLLFALRIPSSDEN